MNIPSLISLFKQCNASKSLLQAKLIHQKILTSGFQTDTTLCKNLINLYSSCRCHGFAELVFRTIQNPLDISLWNALLASYAKNHAHIEATKLFGTLLRHPSLKPDCFTYPSVLKACGALEWIRCGRSMHGQFVKSGYVFDVVIASSLVGVYAKCGCFDNAVQLFDEMSDRDVASWNTVISCYYQSGESEKALDMFGRMKGLGFQPNSVTLTTAIAACARLLDVEKGKEIHGELTRTGFVLDDFMSSALVDMYGKCGCLDMAEDVFRRMPKRTVVAWNSLISAHGSLGQCNRCIELLGRMILEGVGPTPTTLSTILMACSRSAQLQPGAFLHGYIIRNRVFPDQFIHSALIDLYFKCGKPQTAEIVFRTIPKPGIVSWNLMILGYINAGNCFEALGIYNQMRPAGVNPDATTFTSALSACSQLAALEQGKAVHVSVSESGLETNEVVMGALLDMYAKCGAMNEALSIFHNLPIRDLVSWTTMITAYGSHGQAKHALQLFNQMLEEDNVKPDGVALLAVLSACSHAGLVDEGCYYFKQMIDEHKLHPLYEHYSCLIDLLGRSGRLHEAYIVLSTNAEIRDDVELLSTLFSACCFHREVELGGRIGKAIVEKGSSDPSIYVALSNMYASSRKWKEVGEVRLRMKELGLRKSNPGCSWIEIDGGRIVQFFVGDKWQEESGMVRECLRVLYDHMEEKVERGCWIDGLERLDLVEVGRDDEMMVLVGIL